MKKLIKNFIITVFALTSLFVSCKSQVNGFSLSNLDFTVSKYPGVNILTWKHLNDVDSYKIYKTTKVDGALSNTIEELIYDSSTGITENVYCDTDITYGKKYTYRIVVTPIYYKGSEDKSISVTTPNSQEWPVAGTGFLELENYEKNFGASDVYSRIDENGNEVFVSYTTLKAELIYSRLLYDCNVGVEIPTKPYAKYTVSLINSVGNTEDSQTFYGYKYDQKATIILNSISEGYKSISVTATPLNPIYESITIEDNSNVYISEIDNLKSASKTGLSAKWTDYDFNQNRGYSRIYFIPERKPVINSYNYDYYDVSDYTIYYQTVSETNQLSEIRVLGSLIEDSPKELADYQYFLYEPDGSLMYSNTIEAKEYYYDHEGVSFNGVKAVIYYLVLKYDGKIKSESVTLEVPENTTLITSPEDWDYNKKSLFEDIYFDSENKIHVKVSNYKENYDLPDDTMVKFETFQTHNEALVAVEGELSSSLTYNEDNDFISSTPAEDYWRYYVFRYKYFNNIETLIAVPHAVPHAGWVRNNNNSHRSNYYWEIKYGNLANSPDTISAPGIDFRKSFNKDNYTSINLSFSSSDAKTYGIYRAISTSNESPQLSTFTFLTSTSDNSYTDTSNELLSTGLDKYVYYAIFATGSFGYSDLRTIRVDGLKAPAVNIATDGTTLYWNDVKNASGYRIYKSESNNSDSGTWTSSSTYGTSEEYEKYYSATKDFDKDYYYYVVATSINNGNNETSLPSTIVKIAKQEPPSLTLSDLTLSWNSITNASTYFVYRSTTANGFETDNYTYVESTDSASLSLTRDTENDYYYAVKAYNDTGYTDFSNAVLLAKQE